MRLFGGGGDPPFPCAHVCLPVFSFAEWLLIQKPIFFNIAPFCPQWFDPLGSPAHCYHLGRAKKTWMEAEENCQAVGGHLVSYADHQEEQRVNAASESKAKLQ